MYNPLKQIDTKELELPETVFIRDIESKVFQSIVLQSLSQIEGVETLEGNLFDSLLGDGLDGVKGIHVDQDQKNHSINVRIEINVAYGISIPDKSEEIQNKCKSLNFNSRSHIDIRVQKLYARYELAQ